jgi:hypothetical protein
VVEGVVFRGSEQWQTKVIIWISPDSKLPVSAARTRLCVIAVVGTETGHARSHCSSHSLDLSLTESHLFDALE